MSHVAGATAVTTKPQEKSSKSRLKLYNCFSNNNKTPNSPKYDNLITQPKVNDKRNDGTLAAVMRSDYSRDHKNTS